LTSFLSQIEPRWTTDALYRLPAEELSFSLPIEEEQRIWEVERRQWQREKAKWLMEVREPLLLSSGASRERAALTVWGNRSSLESRSISNDKSIVRYCFLFSPFGVLEMINLLLSSRYSASV
jgi:hypothetical protein